ncbi:hypothetical protein H4I95_07420 [Botrytis cinerea]
MVDMCSSGKKKATRIKYLAQHQKDSFLVFFQSRNVHINILITIVLLLLIP